MEKETRGRVPREEDERKQSGKREGKHIFVICAGLQGGKEAGTSER